MKKIILLGGNSNVNLSWIDKMDKELSKDYQVDKIYYDHWFNNNEMDIIKELDKLKNKCLNYKTYNIVAKSIGSILTLMNIEKGLINPQKIVILGFPLRFIESNNLNIYIILYIALSKSEILFIQQESDPLGSYKEFKMKYPHLNIVKVPGDNHSYLNTFDIKKIIDKFI